MSIYMILAMKKKFNIYCHTTNIWHHNKILGIIFGVFSYEHNNQGSCLFTSKNVRPIVATTLKNSLTCSIQWLILTACQLV